MSDFTVTIEEESAVLVNIKDSKFAVHIVEGFLSMFNLSDLGDVDLTVLEDGAVLVYDASSSKWISQKLLEKQHIEAGHF